MTLLDMLTRDDAAPREQGTSPRRCACSRCGSEGHGDSDRPGRYRTRDFSSDAAAFIEALGLSPAAVCGQPVRFAGDVTAFVKSLSPARR